MKRLIGILIAAALCLPVAASAYWKSIQQVGVVSGASLACSYTPVTTGTQGTAYTGATPSASGGTPSYTFSETGTLPGGLSISSSTGVISGTPTANGSFPSIQVKVTDSLSNVANCGSAFTLVISPSYTGPGDVQSGATVWVGLRAYNASYASATGNIADLVASTGGASVCTLKAATNGNADLSGTYCASTTVPLACAAASGGSCRISKLYDQTGNGHHFTQATLAKMPALVFSVLGGFPIIRFNSTNNTELDTSSFTIANPQTASFVASRTANFTTRQTLFVDGNLAWYSGWTNAANTLFFNAPNSATLTVSDSAFHAIQFITGASASFYVDGTSTSMGSNENTAVGGGLGMGNNGGGFVLALDGDIGEAGVWQSAFTSGAGNSANLNSNQHTYWGF